MTPAAATLLPFDSPHYRHPGPDDVRAVLALLKPRYGTAAAIAGLTGVTARAVRRWLAAPPAKSAAHIPYAAWRLLLIEAGLVAAAAA
jgi:hypothetical protein